MNDFEMKYKGSELEALVEGSASSLFYAGTIEAAYSIPGRNGAQVTVSQAFRTKYSIGEDKEVFYIVDKRVTEVIEGGNAVYIYPADFEGCYFVMGDFEGNDAILDLGATAGDWVVVQGREWVKIVTTPRDISDLDAIRRGAGKGDTSVQAIKVNGKSVAIDEQGLVNIENVAPVGSEFDSSSENTIFGVKAYTDEQKNKLINEYMNVKPTVKIFHSTDTNRSMVYAYHPYCDQFGEGELVVMRYGKTKSPRIKLRGENADEYHVAMTGWRECLGAPRQLSKAFQELKGARYNEPAKLPIGWSLYLDVVEEICKRATVAHCVMDSEDDTEHFDGIISMAQFLKSAPSYKNALQVLHETYYELWETIIGEDINKKPEWSIFGGKRDKLELGVALRVLNPEFQTLLDDGIINKTQFKDRRWYYDSGLGKMIPKYLYSEVCEMVMTTGSISEMRELDLPYCPRLTLKG